MLVDEAAHLGRFISLLDAEVDPAAGRKACRSTSA
jgi:hypothetical protein